MSVVAFIPARGGSERIPRKNIRELAGHPLLAYAIAGAKHAGIFDGIYVSTEDPEIMAVALRYEAEVIKRPAEYATALSSDIHWVNDALAKVACSEFMILRPTNPFRRASTIQDAWVWWEVAQPVDSSRSVSEVSQHPEKMWNIDHPVDGLMSPYLRGMGYNSCPNTDVATQVLEPVYVQNGCIQIAHRRTVQRYHNYTGISVQPIMLRDYEGFDLNTEEDWILAEALIERGLARPEPIT